MPEALVADVNPVQAVEVEQQEQYLHPAAQRPDAGLRHPGAPGHRRSRLSVQPLDGGQQPMDTIGPGCRELLTQ